MAVSVPENPLSGGPLLLTTEEVRLLWSFVHGDIMSAPMRAWLRASLGFCPRHTWAYAVVEIELWESGVGERGGHQPFDVSVLYEDLCRTLSERLDRPRSWGRRVEAALVPSRRCYLCTQLEGAPREGFALGYANSNSAALAAEANLLRHTRRWCAATVEEWLPSACQACLGAAAPETDDGGTRLCRLHLAEAVRTGAADEGHIATLLAGAADRLASIAQRLAALAGSMTAEGAPADARTEASWIEALGFFGGWQFPAYLAGIRADREP
ncbi:hypothetical protein SCMU_37780 [Sinomonas cyclohexanicum]|uniref:Uncharacterized protein n=1 Tax=Sinomonas cyclohexanicum TaxID=322009 RepID=A0ABN6FMJ2_SINCY|nr:hypothetical protein [Corynebacterium cyclohexanicum]BCT77936.1 hypothetical protein SCMU_37780 [Corynebacterium cyclohexanicum]